MNIRYFLSALVLTASAQLQARLVSLNQSSSIAAQLATSPVTVIKCSIAGCQPCKRFEPEFIAVSNDPLFADVLFIMAKDTESIYNKYNVHSFPTTLVFQGTQLRGSIRSYQTRADLKTRLQQILGR